MSRVIPYSMFRFFSSSSLFVVIVFVALLVLCLGILAIRLSAQGSTRYHQVIRALLCATLLPFILVWDRHEAESSYKGTMLALCGNLDPTVWAGDQSEYERERYVLIYIGALGVACMGASLVMRSGRSVGRR